MNTVNIVVVGYGIGRYHCGFIKQVPGLKLRGVCDIDPAKRDLAKKDHGDIVLYPDIEAVLGDKEAHVVVLGLPHAIHKGECVKAANAKKHVIMEKPFCMTVAEADAMIAAARKNKVMLTIAHNRRWDSDYLTVKAAIDGGLIGLPFIIESRVGGWGAPGGWRAFKKHGGSILYDWGAHLTDQILQIRKYPKIRSVYAEKQYRIWNSEVENHVKVLIRFGDDTSAQVEVSQVDRLSLPRWFILGEKGTLRKQTFGADKVEVKTDYGGLEAQFALDPIKGDVADFYRNVLVHLTEGKELLVKPAEARESTRVLEAARKSAETGRAVTLA
ncbi:MAG: Gfo/Idh/MocA family oxidoreductase [Planctomycetes bacterium]|nr:Gfo/Idh/MocA family oxidoreductase [Planctomycetota bacterium]